MRLEDGTFYWQPGAWHKGARKLTERHEEAGFPARFRSPEMDLGTTVSSRLDQPPGSQRHAIIRFLGDLRRHSIEQTCQTFRGIPLAFSLSNTRPET